MAKGKNYKVCYVGNFLPNSVGEPEISWALQELGHTVHELQEPNWSEMKDNYLDWLTEHIKKGGYDFLLFAKFRVGSNRDVRDFLTKSNKLLTIPSVCWLFDLYWGYRREREILMDMLPAFNADIVFTTDGGHGEKWKRYGINHFLLRQGIDERVKLGKPIFDTKAEIVFVGSRITWAGWSYRGQLIDFLKLTYGDRFGHLGEGGDVRHENLNNLMATAKIIVCDTVQSDYYWSNRIYETIGRGGFAIHPRIPGLEKEFTEYEHFIPYQYGDFKSLKAKIDYFLEADEEREKIRLAGFNHCHKFHTYKQRCKELIKTLEEQKIL